MNRLPPIALCAFAALPAAADFRYTETALQFQAPSLPWALAVPREDWRVGLEQRRPDGEGFYYMLEGGRGMQFSVYLDKTTECDSAASCRQRWRSAGCGRRMPVIC